MYSSRNSDRNLFVLPVGERQSHHAEQSAQSRPYRLYRMNDQGERRRVILVHAKTNQGSDHHEMPRSDTALNRHRHADTTHRKRDQPDHDTQVLGKVESIERYIKVTEITSPNQ